MSVAIKTLSGDTESFSSDQLDGELRLVFRGRVLAPADDGYDQARAVENLYIDRRPGLIVQCSGVADVIDAVKLARDRNLLVAVRSGGHHVAGHGATDGGLLIDMRRLNGVWVDVENQLVHVQGGATWGDVDREAQAFGLAVPGGVVSTTGVAGLTLGGGIGWLHRKWGLACDALREAEVITGDGERVIASADQNPDLFWGLRGGGGNFGIVVRFTFAAQPLGPIVMAAPVFYRSADAPQVMRAWRDYATDAPDEVTTRALFWSMPAAPGLPEAVHDQDVLIAAAMYAGDPEEGARALQPIRELGEPLADISAPMPYRFFQSALDPLAAGLGSYWKSTYLADLDEQAVNLIVERGMNRPTPETLVHVPLMGGATSRVAPEATAFGDRSAPWLLSVDGNWRDPEKADEVMGWVRSLIGEAERLEGARGSYLLFSADDASDVGALRAQYGGNLKKLADVKRRYDPRNQFRINNNILPSRET